MPTRRSRLHSSGERSNRSSSGFSQSGEHRSRHPFEVRFHLGSNTKAVTPQRWRSCSRNGGYCGPMSTA